MNDLATPTTTPTCGSPSTCGSQEPRPKGSASLSRRPGLTFARAAAITETTRIALERLEAKQAQR